MGRTASGVRGIRLSNTVENDRVISMVCFERGDTSRQILVVSENGYGKRSDIDDYRIINRGGKGVKTINITEKTGNLIAIKAASDDEDLMIINKSGLTIRMHVSDIRSAGRATQGVKLINLRGADKIASVTQVPRADDEEETVETPVNEEFVDETEVAVENTENEAIAENNEAIAEDNSDATEA